MSSEPRISVVTPCFNGERFIERTLASVRAQSYQDWEHVVVDDGSTDHSAEFVVHAMQSEPRLRLIRQPNAGLCAARNSGLRGSSPRSAYLLFLDADDCLEPNALEEMVGYLDAHPEAGMAYCARTFVDADDRPLPAPEEWIVPTARYTPAGWGFRRMPAEEANTPFASLMVVCFAIPSASFIRRSIIEAVGPWDESLMQPWGAYGEDVDMALRVALVSEVHSVPKTLLRYRRHEASMSASLNFAGFAEKWWTGAHLTDSERVMARRALLLNRKVGAYLLFRGSWTALQSGDLRRGARLARQGYWKLRAYLLGYSAWAREAVSRHLSKDLWSRASQTSRGAGQLTGPISHQTGARET